MPGTLNRLFKLEDVVKFRNKYRISSTRLQAWDYGWNGSYYITICTGNRICYFGHIQSGVMHLSELGQIAQKFWIEIPNHFRFVHLSDFVVMPNHVHGIIIIDKPYTGVNVVETRHALSLQPPPPPPPPQTGTIIKPAVPLTTGQKRFQNQGRNTVSSIIGGYKSAVTRNARCTGYDFQWQERFWDHLIRNSNEYKRIKNYIINNPANWHGDDFLTPEMAAMNKE